MKFWFWVFVVFCITSLVLVFTTKQDGWFASFLGWFCASAAQYYIVRKENAD